jgi:nitroreductase
MPEKNGVPYESYREYPPAEMKQRAAAFCEEMQRRRTVRSFSSRPVDRSIIEACVRAAGTAPSGANAQPWHFAVVGDPAVKRAIREEAEKNERAFYEGRAPGEWLEALRPLATDSSKPFLETAPFLIVIFSESYRLLPDGGRAKNYYIPESAGIAAGMLVAALHTAGLAVLTYTPSPMGFLNRLCRRPDNERPFLVVVTGYPADGATVPDIGRKRLEEIASFL